MRPLNENEKRKDENAEKRGGGAGRGGRVRGGAGVAWAPLTTTANNSDFALDTESVEYGPNGTVRAWFKQQYRQPEAINGQLATSVKFNNRYYCKSHQVATGPATAYDVSGKPVYSRSGYSPVDEIVPDTVDDSFLFLLCTIMRAPKA